MSKPLKIIKKKYLKINKKLPGSTKTNQGSGISNLKRMLNDIICKVKKDYKFSILFCNNCRE